MKTAGVLMLIAVLVSATVQADTIEFGVVSRCDETRPYFEMGAFVQHNEQITLVASSLRGIKHLEHGTNRLVCNLGGSLVEATVSVFPPANGHCMGGGYAELSSFKIGGKPVANFPEREAFNYSCLESQMLVGLFAYIIPGGTLVVERCTSAPWNWDTGYSKVVCANQVHER